MKDPIDGKDVVIDVQFNGDDVNELSMEELTSSDSADKKDVKSIPLVLNVKDVRYNAEAELFISLKDKAGKKLETAKKRN